MTADPRPDRTRYPDLEGKTAVVTGGSRGIGAATARALAANGAAVAIIGRDEQALAAVSASILASGGRALAVRADCTVEADLQRGAHIILEQLGPPEILATFAGGSGMPVLTVAETAAHWRVVIESDLTSMFLTASAFLAAMVDRGHGSIITMSSAAARQPAHSNAAYAAAKAGVIAFTRHLANEIAPCGIRVNCIAPSAVENERMRTGTTEQQRQQLASSFPLRRIGRPDDVAAAALFLASDASSWITGITLDVAGGKIML
ncbi:MAG: SDR family oxidoreductase [Actinomycetota bacterium]|nr:SDR family oxidoreductase [Actinomycetota bacterium]